MNARTGSLPWDLTGRALSPEQFKAWLEQRAREQEPIKTDKENKA